MEKKQVVIIAVIALSIIVIAYYLAAPSFTPQPSNEELRRKILETINDVKLRVEEIRGLKFPKELHVEVIDTKWVLEHWAPPTKPTEEEIYEEVVFKLTLLVPPNFSIVESERKWTASFMAATVGYTLYVVKDVFNIEDPVSKRALAHELTHILQYHYFHPEYPSSLDGKLAVLALVEGDADYVADLYCNLTGIPPRPKVGIPVDEPYMALKLFPYIFGEGFVEYLYSKGEWELVNNAYANPPESTEQVLNPEKYLEEEEPVNVRISLSKYGEPLYVNTMGEYYILLVLASKIDMKKAFKAAQGWGGDCLALYREQDKWILCWNITWDTDLDAQEFYEAFTEALAEINASEITCLDNKKVYRLYNYVIEVMIENKITFLRIYTVATET